MCRGGEQKHMWRGGPEVAMLGSGGGRGWFILLWGAKTEGGQRGPPGPREPQNYIFPSLILGSPHSGV